jgi:hypothetical protein
MELLILELVLEETEALVVVALTGAGTGAREHLVRA